MTISVSAAVSLFITACTSADEPSTTSTATSASQSVSQQAEAPTVAGQVDGVGSVTLGSMSVQMTSATAPVSAIPSDPEGATVVQSDALATDLGIRQGATVELRADAADVAQGATITVEFDVALSATSAALLAYWDEDVESWHGVETTVAADRMSISAHVTHFSRWTDFISDFVSDATHAAGSIFDTRVPKPSCEGSPPAWVQSDGVVFVDDQNAPLEWCAGHDPAHPELLVVKVAVNRGYGVVIKPTVAPSWSWSSYFNQSGLDITKAIFTDSQQTISQAASVALTPMTENGQLVPGGFEVDYGFSEDQVRAAPNGGVGLIQAARPDPLELVISMVVKQLADTTDNKVVALAVAILGVSQCVSATVGVSDPAGLYRAFLNCAEAAKDQVTVVNAKQLAGLSKFAGLTEKELAQKSVAATKKFFAIVTLSKLFFQAATFVGDTNFDDSVRQLSVFPVPLKPAVVAMDANNIRTAQVSGGYTVTPGPMTDGARQSDTGGYIGLNDEVPAVFGDLTGDGIADAAAVMDGSSGVGGSYGSVSLFTDGGKLLGDWDGGAYSDARTTVSSLELADGRVTVGWTAVDNNHPFASTWTAQLRWSGGQIVAENVEMLSSEAPADRETLRHDGYEALSLGMTLDEAQAADPSLIVVDSSNCTTAETTDAASVVFNPDGTLRYINVAGTVSTPEGLSIGDTFARAFELYGVTDPYVGASNGENRIPVEPGSNTVYNLLANVPDDWNGDTDLEPSTTTIKDITLDGGQQCFG